MKLCAASTFPFYEVHSKAVVSRFVGVLFFLWRLWRERKNKISSMSLLRQSKNFMQTGETVCLPSVPQNLVEI